MTVAMCHRAIREASAVNDTKRRLGFGSGTPFSSRHKSIRFGRPIEAAAAAADFDPGAWLAIVEEQKLAIALAAGVDPSKVRIRIGH